MKTCWAIAPTSGGYTMGVPVIGESNGVAMSLPARSVEGTSGDEVAGRAKTARISPESIRTTVTDRPGTPLPGPVQFFAQRRTPGVPAIPR